MRLCQRGRVGFRLTDKGRAIHDASLQLFGALRRRRAAQRAARRLVGANCRSASSRAPKELQAGESWMARPLSVSGSRPGRAGRGACRAAPPGRRAGC